VGHCDHWAELMENLLHSNEYWNVVDHGIMVDVIREARSFSLVVTESRQLINVQMKEYEENKLKDLKAKNLLYQTIERDVLETILDRSSSKVIWDSISKNFRAQQRLRGHNYSP